MYSVDNSKMLIFLQNDIIKNFYTCDNIVNAGNKGYGVTGITFYSRYEEALDEYVSFTVNWCNDLIIYTNSVDKTFLKEIYEKVKEVFHQYNDITFASPYIELIDSDEFNTYFSVNEMNISEYGVFAIYSKRDLKRLLLPDNVRIKMYHKNEACEFESYNNATWQGLDNMIKYGNDKDILFILRKDDTVCGYLDANITYENIYDISNVFVLPEYRGNKFGTMLTGEYAFYCYQNDFIPHYGTAVSKYSESVALNSGFTETGRTHYIKLSLKE